MTSKFLAATVAAFSLTTALPALAQGVKIGILNDQSGVYADYGGKWSVEAAKMAIEDFGGEVLGHKIELVTADHQNKPDLATAIARRWYDVENVDMITELTTSSVALAVQELSNEKKKIDIVVGARLPAMFTASGIAILSRLPEERVRQILSHTRLEPMTHFTELDPDKLLERIRVAARRGYAIIENETVLGDISVAAPITDHSGMAVAAINISVPTTRWSVERVEAELTKHVQVAATSISNGPSR